jgi:D-galactose 1-dehydrogenase
MAELVEQGRSDVDLSPMVHVSDAMTLGKRNVVDAFAF